MFRGLEVECSTPSGGVRTHAKRVGEFRSIVNPIYYDKMIYPKSRFLFFRPPY